MCRSRTHCSRNVEAELTVAATEAELTVAATEAELTVAEQPRWKTPQAKKMQYGWQAIMDV